MKIALEWIKWKIPRISCFRPGEGGFTVIRHKPFDPEMSLQVATHRWSLGSDGCRIISLGWRGTTLDPYSGAYYSEQTECEEFTGRLQPAPFYPTHPCMGASQYVLFVHIKPSQPWPLQCPLPSLPHLLPDLLRRPHNVGSFAGVLNELKSGWGHSSRLSPQPQLRVGPIQSHSGSSCYSNHTLSPVSRSQVAVPSAPGVLTELKQTENDSIENCLSQNFRTVPLPAPAPSTSVTTDNRVRVLALCCKNGIDSERWHHGSSSGSLCAADRQIRPGSHRFVSHKSPSFCQALSSIKY